MDGSSQLERRNVSEVPGLEVKTDQNGRTVIRGYAAVYNSDSQDLGGFIERIMPGAFDEVLTKNPDVFGRYNHERLLGRTSSGTVRLYADERGLRYEIDPKPADIDVVQSLERGDIRGSSFAFRSSGKNERWFKDDAGQMVREIRSFDYLGDVGPVDEPAYLATEAFVSKRAMQIAAGELSPTDNPDMPDPDDDDEIDVPMSREETDERQIGLVDEDPEECLEQAEGRAVNLKPTTGMAAAAKRGLRLHEEGKSGDGLKPETVARANKLARREDMNRDWVVEMNAWFKRHASDRKPGWDNPGSETPGFVAYLLWGGRPAELFSARKVAELERAGERSAPVAAEACDAFKPDVDYAGKIAALKATILRADLHG